MKRKAAQPNPIAERNDRFRKSMDLSLGKVLLTASVNASPDRDAIIRAIKRFDAFNADNDPHGEHDFGAVTVNRKKYFFKIDYYDDDFECFRRDGNRVLTVMLASEY